MHSVKLFRLIAIFIAISLSASNAFAQDECRKFENGHFTLRHWHTAASQDEKNAFCQCEIGEYQKINLTTNDCLYVLDSMIGESVQDMHIKTALPLGLALIIYTKR